MAGRSSAVVWQLEVRRKQEAAQTVDLSVLTAQRPFQRRIPTYQIRTNDSIERQFDCLILTHVRALSPRQKLSDENLIISDFAGNRQI